MRSHRFVGLCESKEGKTFARRDSRSEVDFSHFRRREKSLSQIWGPCSRSRLGRPPHTGGLPHQFWLQQEQVPFQHCNTKHTTVPTPPRTPDGIVDLSEGRERSGDKCYCRAHVTKEGERRGFRSRSRCY